MPTRRGNRGSQFGRNLRSHERRSSRPPTVHSAWDEFALAYRELATDAKAQRADQSRSFARFYEEGPATLEPAFVELEWALPLVPDHAAARATLAQNPRRLIVEISEVEALSDRPREVLLSPTRRVEDPRSVASRPPPSPRGGRVEDPSAVAADPTRRQDRRSQFSVAALISATCPHPAHAAGGSRIPALLRPTAVHGGRVEDPAPSRRTRPPQPTRRQGRRSQLSVAAGPHLGHVSAPSPRGGRVEDPSAVAADPTSAAHGTAGPRIPLLRRGRPYPEFGSGSLPVHGPTTPRGRASCGGFAPATGDAHLAALPSHQIRVAKRVSHRLTTSLAQPAKPLRGARRQPLTRVFHVEHPTPPELVPSTTPASPSNSRRST